MQRSSLSDWYRTPLGAYVLAREQSFCDEVVADIFGFNALQLGNAHIDFLRASRMPLRFTVGTEPGGRPGAKDSQGAHVYSHVRAEDKLGAHVPAKDKLGAHVRARGTELPIATQSMDLVLLPHALEFAADPHQILREVDRVMMPEGRLIVIGFNPWSLWGLRQALGRRGDEHPWCGDFISMVRLKDWLALLGFDVSAGRLACYAPPLANERWLSRFHFMEAAGDRWWGIAGGVYMMQAIKRVQGMRLITPRWKERRIADKAVAPLSRRSGEAPPLARRGAVGAAWPRQGANTTAQAAQSELPSNVIALPRKK